MEKLTARNTAWRHLVLRSVILTPGVANAHGSNEIIRDIQGREPQMQPRKDQNQWPQRVIEADDVGG
jgi:hypothetical protein